MMSWARWMVVAVVGAMAASALAEPRELGAGRHPLVDRELLGEIRGNAEWVLHAPERREVVLQLDQPWEGKMSGYGLVMRDGEGKVRMYYRGGGDVDPPEVTCLALSADGVHFDRPALGLYPVKGTKQNNVVFTATRSSYGESHNFAPFLDRNPAAAADARWKAVALKVEADDNGQKRRMLTVLASADGVKWRALSDKAVLREGSFDSLNIAFWDEARNQYACYFRTAVNGMRSFARAHSKDFLHWTVDPALDFQPAQDEQWYTNAVTPYPGVRSLYLAMPMRFVPERKSVGDPPRVTDGVSDAVLMTSRDGQVWQRDFRQGWIWPGPDQANWGDAHGNMTPLAGVIETAKGQWSVYWFEGYGTGTPHVRRATVRQDGLAGVRAGADGGELLTPLLRVAPAGVKLKLNFATSARGSVRVEVQDEQGNPQPGYAAPDCQEMWGDELDRPVRWKEHDTLPPGTLRLRFVMHDAEFFSLQADRP